MAQTTGPIQRQGCIGILVSGGPAPGINSVISAVIREGHRRGIVVKGLRNGFRGLSTRDRDAVVDLTLEDATRIHHSGGSILGTSRFNPFSTEDTERAFLDGLAAHRIHRLIVIGGEGSAYISYRLSKIASDISVVHVPKTIDNDLILPNKHPSFGFETARYVGTSILQTLMTDAETCERWFLVTSMGRKAGFLALGLGIASGATLTLIPEEFGDEKPTIQTVARIIVESIRKQKARGLDYGVAILAEGILDALDPDSSEELRSAPRDELGRIRYSLLELGEVIIKPLRSMCQAQGLDVKINTKNIGYELRCHDPVSFDIEYTTFLGYGAVRLLDEGASGVMVIRDFDQLGHINLTDMVQPGGGGMLSRSVDLNSDLYQVARSFMVR